MLAPPFDFDIVQLSHALQESWSIADPVLDYLPVGFGSHHWRASDVEGRRWFVTVDEHRDAGTIEDLRRAFFSASALRRDAGLEFILAPVPAADGGILRVLLDGRFTVAVTPWVDASPLGQGRFTSTNDRARVLPMLGRLHSATSQAEGALPPDVDLALPDRENLCQALDDLHGPWTMGPYGEATRVLLQADQDRLRVALARYDDLEATVRAGGSGRWVVTHGEPHTANVLRGEGGSLHLIDWDTARIAPRERDLWMVLDDSSDPTRYAVASDSPPISDDALRLFRMRWDLGEIATHVTQFHVSHENDPNTRGAWDNLNTYMPVSDDHLLAVIE